MLTYVKRRKGELKLTVENPELFYSRINKTPNLEADTSDNIKLPPVEIDKGVFRLLAIFSFEVRKDKPIAYIHGIRKHSPHGELEWIVGNEYYTRFSKQRDWSCV